MALPTYIRAARALQLHPEAVNWAFRASTAGGTVSSSVLVAVSNFCEAIDTAKLRSSMYRLNLFCGEFGGCFTPLYTGPVPGGTVFGNAADINNNFLASSFVETGLTGGLKGNGVAGFLNTGLATNSLPSGNDVHLSCSGIELATSGNKQFLGSFDNGGSLCVLDEFSAGYSGGVRAFRVATYTAGAFPQVTTPGTTESHIIGSKTSATSAVLYRGGTAAASSAANLAFARTAFPIYVFVLNTLNNVVSSGCSAGRFRMYSIGAGVNADQAAAFSAAVITFNTALGRV